ncbi:hypothetical protein SGPA1_21912 [Streptomyces misionensis JCM 4497]
MLERAGVRAEPGPALDPHPVPQRGPRQRTGDRAAQVDPQAHAALRRLPAPVGELAAQLRGQVVALRAQQRQPPSKDLRLPGDQPQRHQLVEDRPRHVRRDPLRRQLRDQPRARPHPAHPQTRPVPLAERADGDDLLGAAPRHQRRERRGRGHVERDVRDRLVDDQPGAGRPRVRDDPLPLLARHQPARRVLEVRDQIREPGCRLPQRRPEQLRVPAVLRHRHRRGAKPQLPYDGQGVGVRRVLHRDPVAGPSQQGERERHRLLRARRDQDLLGQRRQSAACVPLGDRGTQLRQTVGVVARCRRVPGQVVGGGRVGGGQLVGQGAGCRDGQVDHVLPRERGAHTGQSRALRQLRPRPGPAPADRVAALPEQVVRGGHGGPADAERHRELALRGQPGVQRDPAVEQQRPYALRERPVAGPFPGDPGHLRGEPPAAQSVDSAPRRHATSPSLALHSRPINLQTRRRPPDSGLGGNEETRHAPRQERLQRPDRAHAAAPRRERVAPRGRPAPPPPDDRPAPPLPDRRRRQRITREPGRAAPRRGRGPSLRPPARRPQRVGAAGGRGPVLPLAGPAVGPPLVRGGAHPAGRRLRARLRRGAGRHRRHAARGTRAAGPRPARPGGPPRRPAGPRHSPGPAPRPRTPSCTPPRALPGPDGAAGPAGPSGPEGTAPSDSDRLRDVKGQASPMASRRYQPRPAREHPGRPLPASVRHTGGSCQAPAPPSTGRIAPVT